MTYVCWNIHQRGRQSQCEEVNITAVCNEQGQWDSNIDDICAEPIIDIVPELMYKINLISV